MQPPKLAYCLQPGLLGSVLGGILVLTLNTEIGQAQIPPSDLDLNAPPQVMELLQTPLKQPQVSNETPSPKSLTIPGLWWTDRLFGEKMVVHWFTYRRLQEGNSQVRLIVRPDLWSRYTYLERYSFLKRFGATTSSAGYHLLVMDRQNYPLGAYTCQFPPHTKPLILYPWVQDSAKQQTKTLPNIQAPCSAWISPVYGSQFF